MLLDRLDRINNNESRVPYLRLSLLSHLDDEIPGVLTDIDPISATDVGFVHIIIRPPEQDNEKRSGRHYVDDVLLDVLANTLRPGERLTPGHKKALYDAQVQALVRNEIFAVINKLRIGQAEQYFVPKSVVTQDSRGQDKHLTFFVAGANEGDDSHLYVCVMDTTPNKAILTETYSLVEHKLYELMPGYVDCCFLLDETDRVRAIAKKGSMTPRIAHAFERLSLQIPVLIRAKKEIGAVIDPNEERLYSEGYDEPAKGFRLSHICCGPSGEDTIVFVADLADQAVYSKRKTGKLSGPIARISTGIIKSDLRQAAEGVGSVLDARDGVIQHELDKSLRRAEHLKNIFTSIVFQDMHELD